MSALNTTSKLDLTGAEVELANINLSSVSTVGAHQKIVKSFDRLAEHAKMTTNRYNAHIMLENI